MSVSLPNKCTKTHSQTHPDVWCVHLRISFAYVHTHTCIHTHTYIHTHIHTYIHPLLWTLLLTCCDACSGNESRAILDMWIISLIPICWRIGLEGSSIVLSGSTWRPLLGFKIPDYLMATHASECVQSNTHIGNSPLQVSSFCGHTCYFIVKWIHCMYHSRARYVPFPMRLSTM
jgi:hypothetical protein